jgi:hypothetical protein
MPGNPLTDDNWANEVTDQITEFVGTVRQKTTDNAIVVVRGVVFGLLAAFIGFALLVLLLIFATRGLQSIFNLFLSWERAVYVSYFVIGGILSIVGLLLMKKRTSAF